MGKSDSRRELDCEGKELSMVVGNGGGPYATVKFLRPATMMMIEVVRYYRPIGSFSVIRHYPWLQTKI